VDTTPDVKAEVRCCSDDYKLGWSKKCNIWSTSKTPDCHQEVSFDEAVAICDAMDARLCTKSEMVRDCTTSGGCANDNRQVWTSTVGYEEVA